MATKWHKKGLKEANMLNGKVKINHSIVAFDKWRLKEHYTNTKGTVKEHHRC